MTVTFADALAQTISAKRAADFVRSGMWLDYGTSLCQPDVFDKALGARVHELTRSAAPRASDPRALQRVADSGRISTRLVGLTVWGRLARCLS
jgi:hypothetical protein